MKRRADYTIVLVNQNTVCRADFDRRHTASCRMESEKIDSDSKLVQAIDKTQRGNERFGNTTVILSAGLWTQKVSLPRLSITDLTDPELASALRFETETLCGLDADTMSIAFRRLEQNSDEVIFWATVSPQEEYDSVLRYLEADGVKRVLIGHPAGLCGTVEDSDHPTGKAARARIEFWRDLVARFDETTGELETFSHLSGESSQWRQDLGLDEGSEPIPTWLDEQNSARVDPGPGDPIFRLADRESLTEWMGRVKSNLIRSRIHVPLIERPRPVSFPRQRLLAKTLLALLAVIGCLANWQWLNQRQRNLTEAAEVLRKPAEEKKKFDLQIARIKKQAKSISVQARQNDIDATMVKFLLEDQSDRLNRLLNYLRQLHTDDILIRQIVNDDKGIAITGISLSSETAPLLATQLRQLTLPMGWKAHAAKQMGEKKMVNGGPWTFTIVLEDVGPFNADNSTAQISNSPTGYPASKQR